MSLDGTKKLKNVIDSYARSRSSQSIPNAADRMHRNTESIKKLIKLWLYGLTLVIESSFKARFLTGWKFGKRRFSRFARLQQFHASKQEKSRTRDCGFAGSPSTWWWCSSSSCRALRHRSLRLRRLPTGPEGGLRYSVAFRFPPCTGND